MRPLQAPLYWRRTMNERRPIMCFRPADVSAGPKECPACGKVIPVIAGMPFPETCPGCGADVSSLDPAKAAAAAGAPAAPAAPGAPSAPKAPAVPAAPKAPGAPQN